MDNTLQITPITIKLAPVTDRYSSQLRKNCFTETCSGSEAGSYLRPVDFGVTQVKASEY